MTMPTVPSSDDIRGPLAARLRPTDAPAGTPLRDLADEAPAPAEATLAGHRVHVVLEDGPDYTVRVDNRDFIRWDKTAPRQKWDAKAQPFLFQAFLAWSASRRQGLTDLDFDTFTDRATECADVKDEAEDEARPTR